MKDALVVLGYIVFFVGCWRYINWRGAKDLEAAKKKHREQMGNFWLNKIFERDLDETTHGKL